MTGVSLGNNLAPGFSDTVLDSQGTFRLLLDAMARPGTVHELGALPPAPAPLTPAGAAVCLTLLDLDTPLWLDSACAESSAADYLRFHQGCPVYADPRQAAFALICDPMEVPRLGGFNPGTAEYPDRSTTLIVQVERLSSDGGRSLSGPGIKSTARLNARPLPDSFWSQLMEQAELFPLGVDVILASENSIACLPRTVRVED